MFLIEVIYMTKNQNIRCKSNSLLHLHQLSFCLIINIFLFLIHSQSNINYSQSIHNQEIMLFSFLSREPPEIKLDQPLRVCIVGGGVGGCSAAYFLRKRFGSSVHITVFEKEERLGGRCKNVELGSDAIAAGVRKYETGATIVSGGGG